MHQYTGKYAHKIVYETTEGGKEMNADAKYLRRKIK